MCYLMYLYIYLFCRFQTEKQFQESNGAYNAVQSKISQYEKLIGKFLKSSIFYFIKNLKKLIS